MYIEEKKSWKYLVKKSFWKKISIKIEKDFLTEKDLKWLTAKECDYIFNSKSYKNFEAYLYNADSTKKIIIDSKYLINNIEVLDILKIDESKNLNDTLNPTEKLYKNWLLFKNWLYFDFPINFIFNSNNIEWSKIPKEEVENIIKNKKYTYKVKNEIQEVTNSQKAWEYLNSNFSFTETNIKKLYHILTKDLKQESWQSYPRWFKKTEIIVNNQMTTKPEDVQKEINKLLMYYKQNKNTIFPLQMAFDFHLEYEQIHPFENWNWRTWRFFLNKILLQAWFSPLIVFKNNYKSYFSAITHWEEKKYYKFMLSQYKKTLAKWYSYNLWDESNITFKKLKKNTQNI